MLHDGQRPLDRLVILTFGTPTGGACPSNICIWVPLTGTLGVLLLATTALYAMGRPLICPCGYVKILHTGIDDREVSQHFIDAYTYSYLTRGILLYAVLYLVARARPRVTWACRLALRSEVLGSWSRIPR